jgi:hypothetical protein
MSFSKNIYDKESYKQSINQSVGPGVYTLGAPKVSCKQCYPWAPTNRIQTQGVSHIQNSLLIDIDSDLSGITRKLSKNIMESYTPACPDTVCDSGEVCGQGVVGKCSNGNIPEPNFQHLADCFDPAEDTRLSNPACNLRGTGWNRWTWLHRNPQERLALPFDWNINNRLVVKDNHRPIIPTPIDPTLALPLGGELPREPTQSTESSFTQPTSVHWQCDSNIKRY